MPFISAKASTPMNMHALRWSNRPNRQPAKITVISIQKSVKKCKRENLRVNNDTKKKRKRKEGNA